MTIAYDLLCVGMTPQSKILPSGFWCLLRSLFGCDTYVANCMVLCYGLKLATRWPFGRGSQASQVQPLPLISLGLSGRSYKVIHNCWLTLLDMEANGRGHVATTGRLPPVPGQGQLNKRPRAHGSLLPPASCL